MKFKKTIVTLIVMISALILQFTACTDSSSDDNPSGSNDTLKLTDLNANYSNGKYFVMAYDSSSSFLDASTEYTALENGNTVVLEGLEEASYKFLVWINTTSNGSNIQELFTNSEKGMLIYNEFAGIYTEFGISGLMTDISAKGINITAAGDITGKTVLCIWLMGGSLGTEVRLDDLFSQTYRENCSYIVGFANAAGNGAAATLGTYSVPLITTDAGLPEITYDLV